MTSECRRAMFRLENFALLQCMPVPVPKSMFWEVGSPN